MQSTRAPLVLVTLVALAAGLVVAPAFAGPARPRPAVSLSKPVRIESGLVGGTLTADRLVAVFRGIPYAAPPVGQLRWKAPQPAPSWSGVRSASEFGPACPQVERVGPGGDRITHTSEDCLYLNVWAPTQRVGRHVPVMVWFHGGAFTHGTASSPAYDGESLARRGAVVVTFNYRLGPLGFLAHPLLSRESGHEASGNYGLLDQIAALRWVKANARAFGGSPDRITAFGQAAGAVSISCLLVSPLAHGLFHAAILQSGSALSIPRIGVTRYLKDPPAGEESMEDVGELVSRRLGCDHEDDVLAALRERSAEEILTASRPAPNFFGEGLRFGPIIDRWLIPDRPSTLFARRQAQKVPVLVGANADEGSFFSNLVQPADVDAYRRFVRATFRDRADEVLARFPVTRDAEVRGALARVIGSAGFIAPARRTARAMADLGARTYLYWFSGVRPGQGRGAAHGGEVRYLFNTIGRRGDAEDTERELSLLLIGYWIRFARNGDPNGDNAPPWPRYTASGDQSLEIGEAVEPRAGMYRDTSDFFDRVAGERAASSRGGARPHTR